MIRNRAQELAQSIMDLFCAEYLEDQEAALEIAKILVAREVVIKTKIEREICPLCGKSGKEQKKEGSGDGAE
jgi:hypothetical protein